MLGKRYRGREKEDKMAGDKLQSLKLVAGAVGEGYVQLRKEKNLEISQEKIGKVKTQYETDRKEIG